MKYCVRYEFKAVPSPVIIELVFSDENEAIEVYKNKKYDKKHNKVKFLTLDDKKL